MNKINHIHRFVSVMIVATMILSGVVPNSVSAQGGDDGRRQVNAQQGGDGVKRQVNPQNGRVSFIGPESGRALPASKALGTSIRPQDPARALVDRFAPEFGIKNPGRELSEMKNNRPGAGRVTVRYQQTYQGIPVMGGELIVNTNENGDLYSMNGEVSPDISLQVQPTIDPAQATETALGEMAKWYKKSPADFVASAPELWIFDESLLRPSTRPTELVWRMEVTAKDNAMPVRELVLVDAQRGSISLHFNQVDTGRSEIKNKKVNTSTESIPALAPATYYVTTTGNDGNLCTSTGLPCLTINGAIGKATDGNGDTIKVATGTYTGSGTEVVLINKSVTLSGGWNSTFSSQTGYSTIDGQAARRGITVNSGMTVTIERLMVQNGNSDSDYGGGIKNSGTLTINNSIVTTNTSVSAGGGIGNFPNTSIMTLNNSTVSSNSGSGGGGIFNWGQMTLNNSTINSNLASCNQSFCSYAGYGGGIKNGGTLILNNSTISSNVATGNGGYGGAIYNEGTSTLNSNTISNNTSYTEGGGILSMSGPVTLKNTLLAGNLVRGNASDC